MMTKTWYPAALGLMLFGFGSGGAVAAPEVVPIDAGMNHLTLGGRNIVAVRAWRENYNAHGYDVVTFYAARQDPSKGGLDLVPLLPSAQGGEKEHDEVVVNGGADCLLRDFRLVRGDQGVVQLILADRDFGDSFVSPGTVHFTYYALTRNTDQSVGWPPLYFAAGKKSDSRQAYCDVNEAFERELHLGPSSGAGGR